MFQSVFSCTKSRFVSPGTPSRSLKRYIDNGSLADLAKALACFPDLFELSIDPYGHTVWHLAAERTDASLLRCLHELFSKHAGNGSRPFSKPDKQGKSALHIACARGNVDSVQLLLSWGALPLEERDKKGRLPIHLAARHGGEKTVCLLLQQPDAGLMAASSSHRPQVDGARSTEAPAPTEQNSEAQGHQASEYARSMACAVDGYGLTPLHYATAANDTGSCKLLLALGAPLLATSTAACHKHSMACNAGMTCLHVAAMNNAPQAAALLLMAWVNMSIPKRIAEWMPSTGAWSSRVTLADLRAMCDKEGKTACMVAANRRYQALVKLLDPSSPLPLSDQEPPVKPPAIFCCPITMDLMQDPAVVSDGFTYERLAIDKWLAVHTTSPMTNLPLEQTAVFPNLAIRQAINDWRVEHGMSALPQPASLSLGSRRTASRKHDGFLRDMGSRRAPQFRGY